MQNLTKLDSFFNLNISSHLSLLIDNKNILKEIEQYVSTKNDFLRKSWPNHYILGLYRLSLFCLVAALKPNKIIETGVLHGFTSLTILQALYNNGKGHLTSIDAPSYPKSGPANDDGFKDVLPKNSSPGWVIPSNLKKEWSLKLGKSSDVLPEIIKNNKIDFFLHDSEHTYETMMFEFKTIWPNLKKNGVLIADNIDCNTSFFDFANSVKKEIVVMPSDPSSDKNIYPNIRFGVIKK